MPRRRFLLLMALVLAGTVASVIALTASLRSISQALPLESMHRQRDFAALLLDITRLDRALSVARLAPGPEALDEARFAFELVLLRVRDNTALYPRGDEEVEAFHGRIAAALERLEPLLADGPPPSRALLARHAQAWEELRGQARGLTDQVFQDAVERAIAQRDHLLTLRRHLFAGIALVALAALALLTSLVRQQRAYAQLQSVGQEMRAMAFNDPLTGLANRRLLIDRLQQALAASGRSGQWGAVLFLDLDHFKTLNDTQGHDVGDQLLQQVARRLVTTARASDTVARLGGDEFVVMLETLGASDAEAARHAEALAERVREQIARPYAIARLTHGYHISPSIGVALFQGTAEPVDVLLKQADMALYQAKDAGRNAIRFFNPAMQAAVEQRIQTETALRQAIAAKELQLHYQPQVDAQGRIVAAEALLRWQPPEGPLVLPAEFIDVAEDSGLIAPIGRWVLETACAQLRAWAGQAHARHLQLSVNVSARQFRQPGFETEVRQMLEHAGAPAGQLTIELTESVVLGDVADAKRKMQALRADGVDFSLDDFGTGYASLTYLKQLPFTQIKIDRSFVTDIGRDESDEAICATIIDLGHSLGLDVVAEGVETPMQRDFLRARRCDLMQGHLSGAAMPLEAFERLLRVIPAGTGQSCG
ncbi:putative bifunctional diguanylate cyclase/phosphodiesterase [Acidovorax sp. SDU_ACID1]|uniref:putative bifunctional diguanylate cyclase/phosphodiesterase n=1 Tax=Acidovorax sp. SDU_ACID1 TaxID=3136632 RepID=UPI003872CEC1